MLPSEHQKACQCHINHPKSAKTCEASNQLRVPKYNSSLRHVRCLEVLLNPKNFQPKINSKDLETLSQGAKVCRTAQLAFKAIFLTLVTVVLILIFILKSSQITKKLNFNHTDTVYKNLIPINVNDSILLPVKAYSIRKKYIIKTEKIPEPDLKDFLKPAQPLTNIISEPEIQVGCFQREIDILSYYYKFIT